MKIKGQGHSLTFVQFHSGSTVLNYFFLETARPIEATFHMVLPWDEEMKMSTNVLCHITKVAVFLSMIKSFKKFFSVNKMQMSLKLGMRLWQLDY